METKKILITGLGAGANGAGIQSWLNRFGPVVQVGIIRKGNAADPFALVEMDIVDGPQDARSSLLLSFLFSDRFLQKCEAGKWRVNRAEQ